MSLPTMTPADRLATAARLLYGDGERWTSRLAADLGVGERTIRRWLSGETPLDDDHGAWGDLRALMLRRAADLRKGALRISK